jgi:hypothetical protein
VEAGDDLCCDLSRGEEIVEGVGGRRYDGRRRGDGNHRCRLRCTGLGFGASEELFQVGPRLFALLLFRATFVVDPCDLSRGGRCCAVREEDEREESEAHAYQGGRRRGTAKGG